MSNFLKFIEEDIEAKKTLISTMPTNTKTNTKKYNNKINEMSEKYKEYKVAVKKYLDTKSRSFNIKNSNKRLEEISNKVNNLEHVKFILNPTNTYFEKSGFDNLLYQISNYYDFNFNSLNDIINEFLDKFEQAGIKLDKDDFDYTCYVYEYMRVFLEVRNIKGEGTDKVSEVFEKIYWLNPDIIQHIELNFRKLIRKYEKKFEEYIEKLQKEVLTVNKINNYEECLKKLKEAYNDLSSVDKENISDIIEIAKTGTIDINNYFEGSKIRIATYSSLMIEPISPKEEMAMEKFYENLEKLKINIEEYSNYIKFMPLIEDFKKEYEKQIPSGERSSGKNSQGKNLKSIENQISDKEAKLEKMSKKTINNSVGLFEVQSSNGLKQLKIDSVKQAKELYALYKIYDQEYFKEKVLKILTNSITVSELLHLYYSFDYFKKMAIKRVYEINKYEEIIKYSESFDIFTMNPTNIITKGTFVFEENNLGRVIMNKYRLDNINLTEESISIDELSNLIDKIKFILRVKEIEESKINVEKIWFMVQVEKINKRESKKA